MHRFHIPPGSAKADEVLLSPEESHHALRVLRLAPGDAVTLLDGAGVEARGSILVADKRAVRVGVRERIVHPPLPCAVTLLQALPKGRLMDSIVEKATELGAARIMPLLTEHTVSRPDGDHAANKLEKWRTTALEAVKQCGNPWLPQVEAPVTFAEFLRRAERFDLALVASLHPGARPIRAVFAEFAAREQRRPATVAVWVGPEGDFSPAEIATLVDRGVQPITLGRLVLRCDTAAVTVLALALNEAT
ncbi:MAG: 16S rRNA (uracil(1498)-N(3))-methyltransferase [Verrucomicrobia bacterium]|nr:16S rRNA (uracil(1498)-N(3))-methyltransferase [Verrucomicrobiota bacterium]NDD40756.1 16S rRNA (uracil(1498)-N(3))-methyltransferase [Verrucomicrobiota bacterium]NDF00371.1 16S rRNA (uracil(1498)-N(3))-methyltransferase [Verrucomicrobiota bacterium]